MVWPMSDAGSAIWRTSQVAARRQVNETCNTSPDMAYKIAQHIMVKLPVGRIVEATIRAIIDHTDGQRFQVDFGKDETALIQEWQIVKDPYVRRTARNGTFYLSEIPG